MVSIRKGHDLGLKLNMLLIKYWVKAAERQRAAPGNRIKFKNIRVLNWIIKTLKELSYYSVEILLEE